jgi:hypothetical protein
VLRVLGFSGFAAEPENLANRENVENLDFR